MGKYERSYTDNFSKVITMQKGQVFKNALMSVIQVIINSAVLFLLYRFLLDTLGAEQLGLWALVLASTSVTAVANLGLSGSVVRFVAKYMARDEKEEASKVIQTAFTSVGLFIGLILLIAFPIIKWILGMVVPPQNLNLAYSILPYALFSLWITSITGIFQSGLDGCQRIDLRNVLLIMGAILYLLLCYVLAPQYRLIGVAYAQIIQKLVMLFLAWIFLKKHLSKLPLIPIKWDKKIFREIIGYGINFQIISITQMFYDPITKALLSKFGGLSMVGYYEMAGKMILQFRALIVSAYQVLVPAIADLQEKLPEKIKSVYLTSYQLLFYLALPLFSFIIVATPIISDLWIGHIEKNFVIFSILLSIGWFLNILNVPSYYAYLGIGCLRFNVISHLAIAILNLGFGILFGTFFDGVGVIVAWIISLALGSSVIYISYHLKNGIPLIELLPQPSRPFIAVSLIGIISVFLINNNFRYIFNIGWINSLAFLLFSPVVFISLWFHPMRKVFAGWIKSVLYGVEK